MSDRTHRHDVVIVGGGISGAAALHGLASRDADVVLIESSDRLGGVIRSERTPWGVVELGPNTVQARSDVVTGLIDELGLGDLLLDASPAARHRFVLRDGRPVALPADPRSAIETSLLSGKGKLRAISEAVLPIGRSIPTEEESIGDFVRRRFGRETLDYLVDPMISGVYAGVPDALSIEHAFPQLHALDRQGGSLLRNGIKRMRAARKKGAGRERRSILSFRDGLATLPLAIGERWKDRIIYGAHVAAIERAEDPHSGWRIRVDHDGSDGEVHADHLILALPAYASAHLLAPHDADLANALGLIPHAPVAVVTLRYARSAITHPLDGFGMLVPSREKREILGALFISSIFPERYSPDDAILTLFIGGARRPELVERSDEALIALAGEELRGILDISGDPLDARIQRWSPGIPQYALGYGDIMRRIADGEQRLGDLDLIGSWRGGVSVPDCVENGLRVGERGTGNGERAARHVSERKDIFVSRKK